MDDRLTKHLPGQSIRFMESGNPIIVFDGLCNFCNGWVRFVMRRDPVKRFRFAAAQSSTGARILESFGISQNEPLQTLVLVDGPRHFDKSDAVLEILMRLGGVWSLSALAYLVPRRARDAGYSMFATRRYRLFGASKVCSVPEPQWRDRFL